MLNESSGIIKYIISILLFPLFFQDAFITFAWGAEDQLWIMLAKRLFLLLPVFAIILGCWVTIACALTVIIRQNRREFIIALFVTWWDLGKSVVAFWGGVFKFVFHFFAALLGAVKILVLSIWSIIQEIVFFPFRLIGLAGKNVVSSSIPWIAVFFTVLWCLLEAVIFTYVTTPLVVDTFSNITGETLSENFIRIPLFVFLLFIVLGSYAVLANMIEAVKSKNISAIIGIGVIEIVALFVEVVFLYREFVDSLVPWFAQYSENFELGMFWTLAIAVFVWFGIRSLSWFLFAAHGTPTILSVIQGKGLGAETRATQPKTGYAGIVANFMQKIKDDTSWLQTKGEELLAAFMLPPLQVVAAAVNFCTLLITSNHLFKIPLKTMDDITHPQAIIEGISKKPQVAQEAKRL